MKNITDSDFKEKVEDGTGIMIVDFYADWCGACKEMSKVLEQIEQKYPQVKIYMLDTVENKKTAREYWIMSLPTIVFFQNGTEVKRRMGVLEKEEIETVLMELIILL